ncbi:MAG: Oligopeptide transport system permease protein OppC [Actinobacteria bacterium ADurb.Bin444]|nr:MAG: Oligopeptide transport system permease protein OppC [Actinobacteria bacterium ADurb.Bin444]
MSDTRAHEIDSSVAALAEERDAGAPLTIRQTTLWGDVIRRFMRNRAALLGLSVLALMILYSTIGPWIRPYGFADQDFSIANQLPNAQHWFGTDMFGRDLFVRAAMGGRVSLLVAFAATGVVLVVGVLYGSTSGFIGGKVDDIMMRFVDILYGMPYLPFAIILLVILGGGVVPMLLALAIVSWLTPSRLVRGQILTLKQNEYVEAARALGASQARVVWRHLLPNTLGIIVVAMFLEVPSMILGEAVLSFLGLGISAPNASWGTLAEEGWKALRSYPWLIILPGLFISITVLAFNFVGDGFRDAIDPRTKEGNG